MARLLDFRQRAADIQLNSMRNLIFSTKKLLKLNFLEYVVPDKGGLFLHHPTPICLEQETLSTVHIYQDVEIALLIAPPAKLNNGVMHAPKLLHITYVIAMT